MMFVRLCCALLVTVMLWVLGGCAAPPMRDIAPNPDLFPRVRGEAEPQTPGRVALLVTPEAHATLKPMVPYMPYVRIQTGLIVEQALLLALGDRLHGGVQWVTAVPQTGNGFDGTLVLQSVQLEYRTSHSGWRVSSMYLAFNLRLVDAQGRTAWTRNFQGNRDYPVGEGEPYAITATVTRLAH